MNARRMSPACLVAVLLLVTAGAAPAQDMPAAPKPEPSATGEPSRVAASPLPADIEKAIEKAMDRKLAPIMRTLAEMQGQTVRVTDVLGGLGYIIGLVGVAAYVKRRPGGARR